MRRLIFTLFAFIVTFTALAQDKKEKKTGPWKYGGTISALGGQGGSRNWAAGSDRFSLSFAAYLNLYADKTWGKNTWENSAVVGYALINTSSVGVRKQDDKLDVYSKYGYQLKGKKWKAGFVANLRTQLYKSFDYTESTPRITGRFFAPAYAVFAPGFNFNVCKDFNIFGAPVAARWVIATNQPYSFNYQGGVKPDGSAEVPLSSLYGVNPQSQVRFEAGPFISAQFKKDDLFKNVGYTTRLDAISNFAENEPDKVDLYWTNTIGMRVNKWLQVTYNFDFIYDDDVRMFGPLKNKAAGQFRSLLGVGLTGKF